MPTGKRKESSSTGIGCLPSFLIIIVATILILIIVVYFNEAPKEKNRIEQQKAAVQREEKALNGFINTIEQHYQKLRTFYDNKDFNKAAGEFELFKKYQKIDYKDVSDIGEGIRIGTIEELEKEVKAIPVAKTADNLRIYKQLLELDPENSKYKSKVAFYRARIEEQRRKAQRERELCNFSKGLRIADSSWSKSGSGLTAEWKVLVENLSSKCAFKDIKFKTRYYGPSGTKIDESILGHTEYTIIKPKSKQWITFSEFVHSQANTAGITIAKAERVY